MPEEEISNKKEKEIFDIKIVCAFFSLIIAMTIVLEIGFYKAYSHTFANAFEMYSFFIGIPIIYGVFFIWLFGKLWANFKE